MDSILLVSASILFVFIFYKFLIRRSGSNLPLPSVQKPWPLIGNLPNLGPLPHHSIAALARVYGTLLALKKDAMDEGVKLTDTRIKALLLKGFYRVGKSRTSTFGGTTWSSSHSEPDGGYIAGMRLGLRMVQLLTASLVHAFNREPPEGVKADELNMEEASGMTLHRADPLMVHPRRRQSPEVY